MYLIWDILSIHQIKCYHHPINYAMEVHSPFFHPDGQRLPTQMSNALRLMCNAKCVIKSVLSLLAETDRKWSDIIFIEKKNNCGQTLSRKGRFNVVKGEQQFLTCRNKMKFVSDEELGPWEPAPGLDATAPTAGPRKALQSAARSGVPLRENCRN